MKRSEVNEILREGDAFIRGFGVHLPPFADWTPERFAAEKPNAAALLSARLGWDVTDYGLGDFARTGLFLFTARNGELADLSAGRGMVYAEKIMITRRDQLAPLHRHNVKTEDIINRGGGELVIELFASAPDGAVDEDAPVTVPTDGVLRTTPAGGKLALAPGASVTLHPGVWHAFWAEKDDVLIGEVSTVNDDLTDNIFRDPIGRFSAIVEDESPWRLLVSDYDAPLGA